MKGADLFKIINEIEVIHKNEKLLKTIIQPYSRAPFFNEVIPLIQEVLATMNELNSISKIAELYRKELREIEGILFLDDFLGVKHCYSNFPIFIEKRKFRKTRDEIYEELKRQYIFGKRYFYPLINQFPTYRGLEPATNGKMSVV